MKTTVCGLFRAARQLARSKSAARRAHLRIDDLSKDRGPGGTGCRGYVAGQSAPGLPGKQREGDGFFGLRGKTEVLAGGQIAVERFESRGEHGHKRCVAGAAAGDDEINGAAAHSGSDKVSVARDNGFRGKGGGCGQRVFGPARVLPAGG